MAAHKQIVSNVTVGNETLGFKVPEEEVEKIWPDNTPEEIADRVRELTISCLLADAGNEAAKRLGDKIQMVD